MNRKFVAMLALVLVGAIIFIAFFAYQNRNQTTTDLGVITSDTTWNGTITLNRNVTVCSGVKLIILPGTIVNYNSSILTIDGTLVAIGKNRSITLIGEPQGKIVFNASSTPWNDQSSSGCIIDTCNIIGCTIESLGASPKITNCVLTASEQNSHVIVIDGGSPIITFNSINGVMKSPRDGYEGGIILQTDNNATITNNKIQNCTMGIALSAFLQTLNGTITIQNNLVIGNIYGVYLGSPQKVVLEYNTINLNRFGVRVAGYSNQSVFAYNNIYGNTESALSLEDSWWPTEMYIRNNWWGTTNLEAIRTSIIDSHINPQLATVVVEPVLQTENSNAPKQ